MQEKIHFQSFRYWHTRAKNGYFKTYDFSPLILAVLGGVQKELTKKNVFQDYQITAL